METLFAIISFAYGACIASFLNVVIWRVPRGESIVRPGSHCPKCSAPIRWWQNIPVVSWIALRGRCAKCGAGISPRYIAVEILGGALFAAAFLKFGFFAPVAWVWISLMIAGSFIDFDHKLIPDFVTVGGMVYGLAVSAAFWLAEEFAGFRFAAYPGSRIVITPLASLLGLAAGFAILWTIRFL